MSEKLTKKQNQALSTINYAADAGAGMEGADRDSYAIPFMAVLQPNSPQVVDGLIENAKPGLILNTVSNELYKEIDFIPVAFNRRFLIWAPRETGGGYRGQMLVSEMEQKAEKGEIKPNETGRLVNKEGNLVRDTRQHFVLVKDMSGAWVQACISMSSTQIKRSKKLNSQIAMFNMKGENGQSFNPPSFAHLFHSKTIKESNDKGTWFSWDIARVGLNEDGDLYTMAKNFHQQVKDNKVKVDMSHASSGADEDSGEGEGKGF